MLKKVGQFIWNLIFPKSTEVDLYTFTVVLITSGVYGLMNILRKSNYSLQIVMNELRPYLDDILDPRTLILAFLIVVVIYKIFIHAFSNKQMKDEEKDSFAFFFYVAIGIITISSILTDRRPTDTDTYRRAFSMYVLARSIISLVILYVAGKSKGKLIHFYDRITKYQMSLTEAFFITLITPFLYSYLLMTRPAASAIIETYFYILLLNILPSAFNRYKNSTI